MADMFNFESAGLGPGTFRVLRFTGTEAVSDCYSFELELLSLKEFDIQSLYDSDATFTVTRQDNSSTTYRGRVASIGVERMMSGNYFKCRARLVPHLWFYTLRKSSKAYVGKNITQIISSELKENGEGAFSGFRPEFDQLPATVFPLAVKYHETPLEFISRLLERECLYYYFMADKGMDVLKFSSDAKLASNEALTAKVINNLTFSSLGLEDERILFKSAHMEQAMRSEPLNLYTYDGNPDSVETLHGVGRTAIEKNMLGPLKSISGIRQTQDSRPAVRYNMATSVRGVRVGIVHDGLRALSLQHDGDQSAAVLESLGLPTDGSQKDFYRNQGLWMPQSESFIPEWKLSAPRIANATLTGFTTRINTNGTYDVKCHSIDRVTDLPNVRMVFPFAGKKGQASGMHLPLVDGTEVLLEFLEGDPDRPVIMGSLYNTSVDSPVTAMNKTDHIIYTPRDNMIRLHDGAVTKITIDSPNRIEAISQSEYLVVDSDGQYIEGNSGDHISFTTGGDTSLLLNGSGKNVHMQAGGGVNIDLDHAAEYIVADAKGTKVEVTNAGQDNILLTTNGGAVAEVSGSGDYILLTTAAGGAAAGSGGGASGGGSGGGGGGAWGSGGGSSGGGIGALVAGVGALVAGAAAAASGTSIRIDGAGGDKVAVTTQGGVSFNVDGGGNKVEIFTSGGPTAIIDGGADTIELKTVGGSSVLMDGGKITMKDASDQSVQLNGEAVIIDSIKFTRNTNGKSYEYNDSSSSLTMGIFTDLKIGMSNDFKLAIENEFFLSSGLKIGLAKYFTLKNSKDEVELKKMAALLKSEKNSIKSSLRDLFSVSSSVQDKKEALSYFRLLGSCIIN